MELVLVGLLGLILGSFANVLIVRVPQQKSISFPASHCVSCKTPLKFYHNIPLFSYLFLRGRCAFCSDKISSLYPLVELLSAVIFLTIFYTNGFNIFSLFISLSFLLLLVLSIVDLRYMMVPDSLNFLALIFAIFSSVYFIDNLTNAFLLAGALTLLRFALSSFLKKEAMGEADIIVAATFGAMLGIKASFVAIFFGALFAIVPALFDPKKPLPFIPFLTAGAFFAYLFADKIVALVGI